MSYQNYLNRRINPDGMKGHTDVTTGTDIEESGVANLFGRRKFLILGGVGAAILTGTAGAARALIVAGGPNPSPRSQDPVGLDPGIGRSPDALAAPSGGVYHLALAGTDGWVSFPVAMEGHAADVGASLGAAPVDPYFPDPLADPANRTTYAFCPGVTVNQSQVAAQGAIMRRSIYSTVGQELWIGDQPRRPCADLTDGHTATGTACRSVRGVPARRRGDRPRLTYVYRPLDSRHVHTTATSRTSARRGHAASCS